jgi:Tfp pilus assembly protein PilO
MQNTGKERKQLSLTLEKFYQNPIAQVSIELFLTIGLVLFLALFAIRPTLVTMSDLLKEIEDKNKLNEQLGKKVAALGTAQTQYLALETRLPILDQAIPSDPTIIEVLKIIEKTASDTGIIIESAGVNEIPTKPAAQPVFEQLQKTDITVAVSIVGDYASIRDFVSALQNSRRTLVIDSVVFNVNEDRGVKQLRATVTIDAPYFGVGANAQK